MGKRILTSLILASVVLGMNTVRADQEVTVPFIGCPSDGQAGPIPPPTGKTRKIGVSFKLPGKVAFFKGVQGIGVFAPAGWHCFVSYGSAGATTIVSAHALPTSGMPPRDLGAPTIDISSYAGDTSGRFNVAILGHMLFPDVSKDFVKKVEDEGILSKAQIEKIAYPTDKLTYLNKTLVQFETPANAKVLGNGYLNDATPLLSLVSWNDGDDGVGVSILHVNMGKQDDAWSKVLVMLNTPCVTSSSCLAE